MTEEQKPEYVNDMKRYQYAKLAEHWSKSEENQRYIPSALEGLASDMKEVSDTESKLLRALVEKGEIGDILSIYPKKYEEERNKLTLEQFATHYDKIISGLGEEKSGKLKDYIGKMGSSTLEDIAKKLDEAAYRLTGHKKGYAPLPEGELANFQKIAEKYKLIDNIVKQIEDLYFDDLGNSLIKKAKQKSLGSLV